MFAPSTSSPLCRSAGKFLIFGFAGIFIYEAVKDEGLLASAVFVAGIISHHITPSSILDALPKLSFHRGASNQQVDHEGGRGQRRSAESTDETHRRYEEYQRQNQDEEAKADRGAHEDDLHHRRGYASRNPEYQQKKPEAGANTAQDDLRRERERLKREKDRLEAERRKFNQEQRDFIWKWVRKEINLVAIAESEQYY